MRVRFDRYACFYPSKRLTEESANIALHKRFRKCIDAYEPDLVLSVHPLCQDIPLRVLRRADAERAGVRRGFGYFSRRKKGARTTPFVTIVTDLGGASNHWFDPGVDVCFVPGDAVRRIAESNGLRDEQLMQHGLPIKPSFWDDEPRGRDALRATLGLDAAAPCALVVGGGDGVGAIERVAAALGDELGRSAASGGAAGVSRQMVVVCGTNEAARARLAKRAWPKGVAVKVEGFVENMDEYMAAADCLVTKAGPGTIMEASTRGLPCLLSSFLPGQEAGNVPFVVDQGFGAFERKPANIARTVAGWLDDPPKLAAMRAKARAASSPNATRAIARDIAEIALATP